MCPQSCETTIGNRVESNFDRARRTESKIELRLKSTEKITYQAPLKQSPYYRQSSTLVLACHRCPLIPFLAHQIGPNVWPLLIGLFLSFQFYPVIQVNDQEDGQIQIVVSKVGIS